MDKPFMTYGPAQRLYEAVKNALQASAADDDGSLANALGEARVALAECDQAIAERETYASSIKSARDDYAAPSGDDLEIDDNPVLSVGDEGVWVSAWVWVADSTLDVVI